MNFNRILPIGSKRRALAKALYSKFSPDYTAEELVYRKWIKANEPTKNELSLQRKTKFEISPKISIVVPVFNTPENFFKELVDSLIVQTYPNWELCLGDGSLEPIEYMQGFVKKDSRIKYKFIGENKGISGNTNEALSLATGDFIGLLDHDDLLPAFSLFEVVKAINENPQAEFIYSDEDKLESVKGPRYGVFFKPDFSPYTLNSANYICHFSVFKKELMDKLGGFKSEYDGSQDFDIVARASELTEHIVHIPKVLYHWRAHRNSTAQNSDSKPYAFEIGKKVIKDHIKRSLDTDVTVDDGLTPGSYELIYSVKGNPKVSIIFNAFGLSEEKISEEIKYINDNTTYKNIEIIVISDLKPQGMFTVGKGKNIYEDINIAAASADGEYIFIVDKSLRSIEKSNYIEELLGICQDNSVGIVSTKLFNKDNAVEHCGIILGMNGAGDLLYKGAPKNVGTYMQRLLIIHNVSCVNFAYSLIKKECFNETGGFSLKYSGLCASLELCIKLLKEQKQIVINPTVSFKIEKLLNAVKSETEESELVKEFSDEYKKGDIYFSPNLSKTNTGLSINV